MDTADSPQILGSWKEIAAYLGKGVRTVQRWEMLHGLPVRRPKGAPRGVVYSSREELDQWLQTQWLQRNTEVTAEDGVSDDPIPVNELILSSAALRNANRDLPQAILSKLETMKVKCEALAQSIALCREARGAEAHKVA